MPVFRIFGRVARRLTQVSDFRFSDLSFLHIHSLAYRNLTNRKSLRRYIKNRKSVKKPMEYMDG
ncbi:MAG: hypothetical protein GVY07_03835 [Bacteroidetes bacterium]|nr:hypothetical protein [Bacteroidota bacterium]